jgi:hypothetical protein
MAKVNSIKQRKFRRKLKSESKSRRVDAALQFMEMHKDMSATKTAQIFEIL